MRPIDADALEEMFKAQYECETCDNYDGVRCRACHCDDALGIIDSAPTIDAAPVRRGEWIAVSDDDQDEGMFFCSRCKDERWFGEEVHTCTEAARLCHYCPNCGADMRGVSE